MKGRRRYGTLLLSLGLAGCAQPHRQGAVPEGARYVIGPAYQSDGEWHYPRVFNHYDETGLAIVIPPGHAAATADGETFHQRELMAQSPVLPLPSLVEVTNLVNGRRLAIRVNDRGPAMPGRILAVTRRVADLLDFPADGVVEARVRLLAARSAALQAQLGAGPDLTAAPVAAVQQAALPPPPGAAGQAMIRKPAPAGPRPQFAVLRTALSGRVIQDAPEAGPLYVEIGGFGASRDAFSALDQISGFAGAVTPGREEGRRVYNIRLGPYHSVADADAALRAVLARGVTDPEIVVR